MTQGAAGEANALESQIGDLKKEIQAIANTKELEAKLQTKIAQEEFQFFSIGDHMFPHYFSCRTVETTRPMLRTSWPSKKLWPS